MIVLNLPFAYVPGFGSRYLCTSDGRVYSIPRNGRAGRWMKQSPDSDGYPKIRLTNLDGSQSTWKVCRVIMTSFVGPRPEGLQICHNNGLKSDNRLSNLRYDTPSSNNLDKAKHGTSGGERGSNSKLTWDEVEKIRSEYATGTVSYSGLATKFGVDKSTIGDVVCGHTWKRLPTLKEK
jgi:hypothetical protein